MAGPGRVRHARQARADRTRRVVREDLAVPATQPVVDRGDDVGGVVHRPVGQTVVHRRVREGEVRAHDLHALRLELEPQSLGRRPQGRLRDAVALGPRQPRQHRCDVDHGALRGHEAQRERTRQQQRAEEVRLQQVSKLR